MGLGCRLRHSALMIGDSKTLVLRFMLGSFTIFTGRWADLALAKLTPLVQGIGCDSAQGSNGFRAETRCRFWAEEPMNLKLRFGMIGGDRGIFIGAARYRAVWWLARSHRVVVGYPQHWRFTRLAAGHTFDGSYAKAGSVIPPSRLLKMSRFKSPQIISRKMTPRNRPKTEDLDHVDIQTSPDFGWIFAMPTFSAAC